MKELTYKICNQCGGKMFPQVLSRTFKANGKEIELRGIEGFKCDCCNEEVYSAKEFRMIDKLVHALEDKPAVDVLNLDETAEYLRVSNQTVYNMIRDKRIKAYKIGREWRFLRADIMAYLESASSVNVLSMAAKGGGTDKHDLDIIKQELEKRKSAHEQD